MRSTLPFLAALALAACVPPVQSPSPVPVSPAARVDALADEVVRGLFHEFPEYATLGGYPTADHGRLSDNSVEAVAGFDARLNSWLAQAREIDPAPLAGTPQHRTLSVLRELLEGNTGVRVCRNDLWPVSPTYTGWQGVYPFLATVQPVGSPALRTAAVSRFRSFPGYLDTEVANMREGVRLGYVAPRTGVESVIRQLDALLAAPAAESPFMSPVVRDSSAPPAFRTEMQAVVASEIHPAIQRYRDYLANEYLPVSRTSIAVADIPAGAECYRASVRLHTTLQIEPREIHEIGLREMEKIRGEMQTIARRSFGTEDVTEALRRLKTDTTYTFDSKQEMVSYAQAAVDRARAALPAWFGILPKADVVIQPYPAFQERSAPGGQYNAPSEDGTRPGIYLINTFEPQKQSKAGLESTAFHETYPGHHLQIAIARERPGAHEIVRYFGSSGYSEGWGLYSERLSDEMGLYSGDIDKMGLLSNEALRAARLVVDAGMHALGWTRQQAIDYLMANTTSSLEGATAEVDRYISVPGQATAYMLGNLEIRRLREQAERELGSRFSIRDFHDRVLEDGSVTLPMLRAKIEAWIAAGQ
ncbi:MAG: DUF885 domain-containing protein [Gemmatimonadaceae bacterium]